MTQGTSSLLQPEEQVLSTLNADGSRCWLRPRVSPGRFLTARRWTAWILIAIFTALPFVKINGKPAMLLDFPARQFTLFGATFLATDTVFLALLLVSIFAIIFLLTAFLGRLWCGWACPQTVYLEFVYRAIERVIDGTAGRGGAGRPRSFPRTLLLLGCYLFVSLVVAHTFLAYFVGVDNLRQWLVRSPLEHPGSFLLMAITTAAMMFNFTYFREQTCIVACPYGRFQSVLLDRDSLIISYDPTRGEPRGKGRRTPRDSVALPVVARTSESGNAPTAEERPLGDCIDCGLCVTTCPTGIDIRNGLQMECVACAQCIDACDAVMQKIGLPTGLIRYTSQNRLASGVGRVLRGRVFFYGALLTIVGSLLVWSLSARGEADITLLRGRGMLFNKMPDGRISNSLQIKITNRTGGKQSYRVALADAAEGELLLESALPTLAPLETVTVNAVLVLSAGQFEAGRAAIDLLVTSDAGYEHKITHTAIGPR